MNSISLNFTYYPLVVGQVDKYTFSDYEVEGGHIRLRAELKNTIYTEKEIVWSSSDERVAVVEMGLVRAITTGIADITATLPDGECASCRIQVIDNQARITALHVRLNTQTLVLNKEEGAVLYPCILPVDYFGEGMLDTTFTWSSSDETVAVVDHRGRIYAKTCGRAVITAVSKDVGRTASCEVEVIKKSKEELYADPLEDMEGGCVRVPFGEMKKLVLPKEVAHQPVNWCSANPGIISVDTNGVLTVYRTGRVDIWATFINGGHRVHYVVEAYCAHTADGQPLLPGMQVSEVCINRTNVHLSVGKQVKLYGIVFPATVLERALNWKSSNEKVCRIVRQHINLSGLDEVLVEGVSEGAAEIVGHLTDGSGREHTVCCEVRVSAAEIALEQLKLPSVLEIQCEQVQRIKPEWNENATNYKLVWLSDNRRIVTVDREGYIKGYDGGKAHVYVIAENSLDEEQRQEYQSLADAREIAADKAQRDRLERLLSHAVYAVCEVTVQLAHTCLYNLHAPEEAVTAHSVCLLWNRKSLLDTEELAYYDVFDNGQWVAKTKAIGYTVRNLYEKTEHTFDVVACDFNGKELCRQSVVVKTKQAPVQTLDVTKAPYYAVGDGIATDTYAIQQAIDDCPPGGEVLLPKQGVFLSGALFLKSSMTFRVEGILFGSADPEDYPPIVCRWEGYRKMQLTEENQAATVPVFDENVYSHSSLINIGVYDEGEAGELAPYHTFDVHLCGKGMINGNSFSLAHNEGPCWYTYRKGLPVPQSKKLDQNVRGRVIALYNTKRAYLSDLTVAYGPSWTIHPVFSDQVTCDNLNIISMGDGRTGATEGMLVLNGDGIDPDSSTNVNVVDCYFTVGDDAIAIKSGRNRQGNELDKPSAYIRVTDSVCVDAKGSFAIGSEQAGGVHDVLFQNLFVENLKNFGLWIKTAPCRGGLVEDVLWRDCVLKDTGGALQIEYNHGGDENPALELPHTRRITYENIRFEGRNKFGIRVMGVEGSLIHDVEFRGLEFKEFEAYKERKFVLSKCEDIRFIDAELPEGYAWEMEP